MKGLFRTEKIIARHSLRPRGKAWAVTVAVVAATTMAVGLASTGSGAAPVSHASVVPASQITMVFSTRTVTGAYETEWNAGAKAYAQHIGAHFETLQSGTNSEAQLSQIQTLLATTKGKVLINIDPNTNAITTAVAKAVQKDPNAYLSVFWNKPSGVEPWNGYSHWVSYINFNGVTAGEDTAKVLFRAMGGKGDIIALQGILDNVPEIQRYDGLLLALKAYPHIKLLAAQVANWDPTTAYSLTRTLVAKYGSEIAGAWGADDGTAEGVLRGLKASGLSKVPVVGAAGGFFDAVQCIESGCGDLATMSPDAFWQGGEGLALDYCAMEGQINVASLPHLDRSFYAAQFLITKVNAAKYASMPAAAPYYSQWSCPALFHRVVSAAG
jgi:ribose transport system substrate-binding protein